MAGSEQEQACLRSKAHHNFSSQRLTGYWQRLTGYWQRLTGYWYTGILYFFASTNLQEV